MVRRWLYRLVGAAVLAALFAYVPHVVYESEGYVRYRRMAAELGELERRREGLRKENQALRRDVRRLRGDLDTLRRVARDELGLVDPGDLVIQVERP
jgi:cell division protein FtsB